MVSMRISSTGSNKCTTAPKNGALSVYKSKEVSGCLLEVTKAFDIKCHLRLFSKSTFFEFSVRYSIKVFVKKITSVYKKTLADLNEHPLYRFLYGFRILDYRKFLNHLRFYDVRSFLALLYNTVDLFWIAADILKLLLKFIYIYIYIGNPLKS